MAVSVETSSTVKLPLVGFFSGWVEKKKTFNIIENYTKYVRQTQVLVVRKENERKRKPKYHLGVWQELADESHIGYVFEGLGHGHTNDRYEDSALIGHGQFYDRLCCQYYASEPLLVHALAADDISDFGAEK